MKNNSTPKKRANHKGLSKLQKTILKLAKHQGGEVLAREVLVEVYGFRPIRSIYSVRQGILIFNKAEIGYARYNAATVALCKSFNRLINRGFAWKIHGGIRLKWTRYNANGKRANMYGSHCSYKIARIN